MHPISAQSSYENDIRMAAAEINCLLGAFAYLPYVDRLQDGKTPFSMAVGPNYVGGCDGESAMSIVPSEF